MWVNWARGTFIAPSFPARNLAGGTLSVASRNVSNATRRPELLKAILVLDEVETLQRVRSDARTKALNAIRQLLDDVDGGFSFN